MIEIRFHGRGGQGSVTSAELVALAAIEEKKWAQSMPSFGPERRGAPVQAYLRVSEEQILVRAEIIKPDIVLVLDDSLLTIMDVTSGLKDNGLLVVNTKRPAKEVQELTKFKGKLATVDALKIAMEELKVPITNTTMIGALLKAQELVKLASIKDQIKARFNAKLAERNINALDRSFKETKLN